MDSVLPRVAAAGALNAQGLSGNPGTAPGTPVPDAENQWTKPNRMKTMVVVKRMEDRVYKIFTEAEWNKFQETGQFSGSADDLRDGFIHLSTKEQVDGVIEKYFSGKRPLYVAEFADADFLQRLKWEASASGEIYPHLYSFDLFVSEVKQFVTLQNAT